MRGFVDFYSELCWWHKSGAAEAGEVARNQAPPHRLDWPITAMFILGIRKSKIKQNGYYLSFDFLSWNISHKCTLTINQYVHIHESHHNHYKILQFLMLNKYILQ